MGYSYNFNDYRKKKCLKPLHDLKNESNLAIEHRVTLAPFVILISI